MALTKRGSTWHTHFFIDGQRFRHSLQTSDWREAQAKEKVLIAAAQTGKLAATKNAVAKLTFSQAAARFLEDRLSHLAPRSIQTERERAKAINRHIGNVQVSRIAVLNVQDYIRGRKAESIANATINRELDIIRGVLKKAKRWHQFADDIHPLPVRHNIGRALSPEDKLHLLNIAAARAEWQNAAWAASLALNTTMRGCEIKQLRWRDIDLIERTLAVRKSKTDAGERMIPLNADAWETFLALWRRAQALGATQLEHYVFPTCETATIDPTRPQKSWRTSWRHLTRVVSCPTCKRLQNPADKCSDDTCRTLIKGLRSPLAGLRFHDLRHHAITELAESQASDSTVMSIAGHVSQKMLQHYSHVRLQAKRTALDSLSMKRDFAGGIEVERGGYDANSDTKMSLSYIPMPHVIDSMVELCGIEPQTSSLRNQPAHRKRTRPSKLK
jgi:integrase